MGDAERREKRWEIRGGEERREKRWEIRRGEEREEMGRAERGELGGKDIWYQLETCTLPIARCPKTVTFDRLVLESIDSI